MVRSRDDGVPIRSHREKHIGRSYALGISVFICVLIAGVTFAFGYRIVKIDNTKVEPSVRHTTPPVDVPAGKAISTNLKSPVIVNIKTSPTPSTYPNTPTEMGLPNEDNVIETFKKLRGEWHVIEATEGGRILAIAGLLLTIEGNRMFASLNPSDPVTIVLNPESKPASFTTIDSLNRVSLGIYELDGDSFRFCVSRPTGATKITSADMDLAGRFGNWPEDFDDITLESQSKYLDAAEKLISNQQ